MDRVHVTRTDMGFGCVRRTRPPGTAALLAAALFPPPVLAGSGQDNNEGTIDITLNFRFAPSAALFCS